MWYLPGFRILDRQVDVPQKQRKGILLVKQIVLRKKLASRNSEPRTEQHWGSSLASTEHEREARSLAGGLQSQSPRPNERTMGLYVLDSPAGWLQRISQALHSPNFPSTSCPHTMIYLVSLPQKAGLYWLQQGWLWIISREATDVALCFSFKILSALYKCGVGPCRRQSPRPLGPRQ